MDYILIIKIATVISSAVALLFSYYSYRGIIRLPSGTAKMKEIAQAIEVGAKAYLKAQYRVIGVAAGVIFLILFIVINPVTAFGFLLGACASALSGFLGMMTAVKSNVRTAERAKDGLASALRVAFKGGSVTGFLVASLGLLSTSLFYFFTQNLGALVGLGFGGSLISAFSRVGGASLRKLLMLGPIWLAKLRKIYRRMTQEIQVL